MNNIKKQFFGRMAIMKAVRQLCVSALTALLIASPAMADVQGDLNGYFSSLGFDGNVSQAQAWQGQAAGYMTGDVACWDAAFNGAEELLGSHEGGRFVAGMVAARERVAALEREERHIALWSIVTMRSMCSQPRMPSCSPGSSDALLKR